MRIHARFKLGVWRLAFLFSMVGTINFLSNANAQTVIGGDDFDGGGTFTSVTFTPDNSDSGGAFPSSTTDVFGIVDRTINSNFADDSLSISPADDFGIIPEGRTDQFLGFSDLTNSDNPSGEVSVAWIFDIAGASGLSISFEAAALGNFENADTLTFTASIDGNTPFTLAEGTFNDSIDNFEYTLESGATVLLDDPFQINGTIINNVFQTLNFPIVGSGSFLELELSANSNGGSEVIAIDNVLVLAESVAVPEPSSCAIFLVASLVATLRRKKQF